MKNKTTDKEIFHSPKRFWKYIDAISRKTGVEVRCEHSEYYGHNMQMEFVVRAEYCGFHSTLFVPISDIKVWGRRTPSLRMLAILQAVRAVYPDIKGMTIEEVKQKLQLQ